MTIVLVDAKQRQIMVVDTGTDEVVRTVRLNEHEKAAQIVRYSPNGKYLIACGHPRPACGFAD